MDYWVQNDALTGVPTTMKLTAKGAATRARFVATAADLVLARGVRCTR
jgi:hypothetical protein